MSFCVYRAASGAAEVRHLKKPAGATAGALEGPGLFDPGRSLCSLLLDGSVGAWEAWLFCAKHLCPLTKSIYLQMDWLIYWV